MRLGEDAEKAFLGNGGDGGGKLSTLDARNHLKLNGGALQMAKTTPIAKSIAVVKKKSKNKKKMKYKKPAPLKR